MRRVTKLPFTAPADGAYDFSPIFNQELRKHDPPAPVVFVLRIGGTVAGTGFQPPKTTAVPLVDCDTGDEDPNG